MKKIVTILLCLTLILGLASCSRLTDEQKELVKYHETMIKDYQSMLDKLVKDELLIQDEEIIAKVNKIEEDMEKVQELLDKPEDLDEDKIVNAMITIAVVNKGIQEIEEELK